MRVTISASEPEILREAKAGDLFIVNTDELCECVLARHVLDIAGPQPMTVNQGADSEVVVIGCRVSRGEPGYQVAGTSFVVPSNTAITRLEQIEPAAFRGFQGDQPEPDSIYAALQAIHEQVHSAFDEAVAEIGRAVHAQSPESKL